MIRRRVMISSTARDLPQHREQVRLACERAGFAPHDMMEHLTALNADAIHASLKMVEEADVYIGIFAYRYGYVPDGHSISITEMEYNRAVELANQGSYSSFMKTIRSSARISKPVQVQRNSKC